MGRNELLKSNRRGLAEILLTWAFAVRWYIGQGKQGRLVYEFVNLFEAITAW